MKKSQEYKHNTKEDNYLVADDFIKYDDFSIKRQEEENLILDSHMKIIKENAQLLTKEGELISNVKGVGSEEFKMDEYTKNLEIIINKKISLYADLKKKLETYMQNVKKQNKNSNLFI